MKYFDLKQCLECVKQTFEQKFDRMPQFENMESIFSGIKGTEKPLSYSMIKRLTSRKYWIFDDYWIVPSWWKLRKDLKKTKGLFMDLPRNEKEAIGKLYDVFKNIEVVSIVLRFVDPENFAIISPPVRFVLKQPPRETYIEEYLDYLSTLRRYAQEYECGKVADADLALWALVEKCIMRKNTSCSNFKKYQEKAVEIEEEYIKKSMLYRQLEEDLLSMAEEEVKKKESEMEKIKIELDNLKLKRRIFPADLVKLKISPLSPGKKLIHDKKEPYIDGGQEYFINQLVKNKYVHKVIWSENLSSKQPTRISHIEETGELTILYVTKNNYAAKIKVFPADCSDRTHAKYFANIISDYMGIPNLYQKEPPK